MKNRLKYSLSSLFLITMSCLRPCDPHIPLLFSSIGITAIPIHDDIHIFYLEVLFLFNFTISRILLFLVFLDFYRILSINFHVNFIVNFLVNFKVNFLNFIINFISIYSITTDICVKILIFIIFSFKPIYQRFHNNSHMITDQRFFGVIKGKSIDFYQVEVLF